MNTQMKMTTHQITWTIVLALLCGAPACAPLSQEEGQPIPQVRSLDGVKLIDTGITDGYDKATYVQDQYSLRPGESRLLLRFNSLNSKVDQIRVDGNNKVELDVSLKGGQDANIVKAALEVCPVSKNWMMLATWENAAPFGDSGRWLSSGGDYESAGCVRAFDASSTTLKFDVTQWFINYLQGRRVNFGLILISDRPVVILGENSGSLSPRLLWNE
jgi:hypothetical protein